MVHGRIRKKTKDRFKRRIQDAIKGLSKRIQVYKQPIKSECPNCFFDKMTNSSTGKCKWTALEATIKQQEYEDANSAAALRYKYFKVGRCPVCKGKGFLETQRKVWLNALVTWNPKDSKTYNDTSFTPAGLVGSTVAELKTNPDYYKLFKDCTKVVIDGFNCKVAAPPLRRGLGNQSVLVIMVFTSDKLDVKRSEILKKY